MPSNCSCTFPKYSHTFPNRYNFCCWWSIIRHTLRSHSGNTHQEYDENTPWGTQNFPVTRARTENFFLSPAPLKKSYFNKIQSVIWPLTEKVPEPGLSTKSVNLMIGKKKKKENQENTEITSFWYFYPSYVVSQGMVISFFSGSQLSLGKIGIETSISPYRKLNK